MAVGPPRMSTVFTSNPSAPKKPNSCATTSGSVPLSVGVLEAKLTGLVLADSARLTANTVNNTKNSRVNVSDAVFLLRPRRGKIEMGVLRETLMSHPYLYPSLSRGTIDFGNECFDNPSENRLLYFISQNTPLLHRSIFSSQLQRAVSKQLFDRWFFRDQSLLVGEVDQRLEHLSVGLDAVSIGVIAEHLLGPRQIFFAKEKRRRNAVDQLRIEVLFGFYKAGIQIERDPGILFINVAANGVGVVDREKAPFLKEARALRHAIGKQ